MARKKKETAPAEVARIEVEGGIIIKFEDGSAQFIPNPIKLTAEQVTELFGEDSDDDEEDEDSDDEEDDEEEDEDEEEEDSDDEDSDDDEEEDSDDDEEDEDDEEDDEPLTGEALAEMDFEELEDVCDDKNLETDPDDYDEGDEDKLRKAIAKELGISLPKAKKEKAKGKKGKK